MRLQKVMRYGAPELQATYPRRLLIGAVVSITLHLLVLAIVFWFRDSPTMRSPFAHHYHNDTLSLPITLMDLGPAGGGGGAPDRTEPVGPAKKGSPDANPALPKQTASLAPKQIGKVKVVADAKKPEKKETGKAIRDTAKTTDRAGGEVGQHSKGSGDKPASGSGGEGTGRGTGSGVGDFAAEGMGSRGWTVRPTARYPDNADASGSVKLRFTVLPDGSITSIVPIRSPNKALLDAAIAGLRRARARALPPTSPQIPQQATITYSFVLK